MNKADLLPNSSTRSGIAFIASMLLMPVAAFPADPPDPAVPTEGSITVEQLEAAINAVVVREGLDEETRSRTVDQLRDAQAQIQSRIASEAAAARFAEALKAAPAETERLRQQLISQAPREPTLESLGVSDNTSLPELEQALARALAELATAESELSEIESKISAQDERPAEARRRTAEIRQRRDELLARADAAAPPGEATVLTDARRLNTDLRLEANLAELQRLDRELLSHGVRLEQLKAERDLAALEFVQQRRKTALLTSVVNDRRQAAASEAVEATTLAEIAAADKHPIIQALAERNASLTRELPAMATDIERVSRELSAVEEKTRQIEQAYARSVQRLEIGGVSQVIGQLFVEERRNLPQVAQYRAEVRERRKALAKVGLAQVQLEEDRRDLAQIDDAIAGVMDEAGGAVAEDEAGQIRDQVELLLRDRRDLLNQAAATYTSYIRVLGDLDVAQRRLLDVADDYKAFLDRNLLWIPSARVFDLQALRTLPSAAAWVLSPRSWADTLQSGTEVLSENLLVTFVIAFLLLLVTAARRPLAVRFEAMNTKIGSVDTDHIGLTLAALGMAVLRALPLPLVLAAVAWTLYDVPVPGEFTSAVVRGLVAVAPFLYNILLFRTLCASDGVLQVHFGWGAGQLPAIRRQLDRLIALGVPVIFVAALVYNSPYPDFRNSLGRLAFVIIMILLSGVVRPLLHPTRGVAAAYYEMNPGSWVSRLRGLWYGVGAGAPLLLAVLSLAGYVYTSAMLTREVVDTFWLALCLILANLVITRWLALTRHRIAWKMTQEEQESVGRADVVTGEDGLAPVQSKPMDLEAVNQQTKRLLHVSLLFTGVLIGWGIWSDVFPALGALEEISLWSRVVTVDGQETIAPVTLADLLLALVLVGVTAVAAANLPGLLEIAVLQHMTLLPGSRYAINTLFRYAVVTVGAVVVLNVIGWNWSQIQWLVAALSVGLGFGLQEIVANFVSGLVILFERPVRVGDTVTVGQLSGKVSRVRIRATTITDWDRKEIIVPNKAFITEQVVNWTLSDPITRIVIPVGIAYGSDVQLAHRVMEQTLLKMPLVLDDPSPRVYFVGFGDSSLNFDLHVYSRELSDRLPLKHAVHEEILAALREHGIEIPFPQRDLHLRSVSPDIRGLGQHAPE
jgi:potassium efflux system protein